jgi:hypothetical protein
MSVSVWLPILLGGIFTIVFTLVGALMALQYSRARRLVQASQNWPSVIGRIDHSTVRKTVHHSSHGSSSHSYYPEVVYSYSVMGTEYQSQQIGFGLNVSGPSSGAKKEAARYRVGSTPRVYYNPQDPSKAVLEQKIRNNAASLFLIIAFLLIGSGACVVTAGILIYRMMSSF